MVTEDVGGALSQTPIPVLAYTPTSNSLRGVVRALSVLGIVLSSFRLLLLPFQSLAVLRQWNMSYPQIGFLRMSWALSFIVGPLLTLWLLMGSIACLRNAPRGRALMVGWARVTLRSRR